MEHALIFHRLCQKPLITRSPSSTSMNYSSVVVWPEHQKQEVPPFGKIKKSKLKVKEQNNNRKQKYAKEEESSLRWLDPVTHVRNLRIFRMRNLLIHHPVLQAQFTPQFAEFLSADLLTVTPFTCNQAG